MPLRNGDRGYGVVSKSLHWLTFALRTPARGGERRLGRPARRRARGALRGGRAALGLVLKRTVVQRDRHLSRML